MGKHGIEWDQTSSNGILVDLWFRLDIESYERHAFYLKNIRVLTSSADMPSDDYVSSHVNDDVMKFVMKH